MTQRYELGTRIGKGGISAVYSAYDRRLQRHVAVKRLLPLEKTQLNETSDDILGREVLTLARFQHPNVVTIFEFDEDEAGPFAVLELIDGLSMQDLIDDGALNYGDFVDIASQLLDPLITANELGLLHRDIKPGNIMLSQLRSGRFQVKILDFGLAKFSRKPMAQTVDISGSFLGSINYVAPEQLDRAPLDQRTDLYSLGCVLYFSLTQISPFKGRTNAETVDNHLEHRVIPISEFRPDIPRAIADWVMLLIERDPDCRPQNAQEAMHLFHKAIALENVPGAPLNPILEPKTENRLAVALADRAAREVHHVPEKLPALKAPAEEEREQTERVVPRPGVAPKRAATRKKQAPDSSPPRKKSVDIALYVMAGIGTASIILMLISLVL